MSFYYIGKPDPENPYRWAYNTSVAATAAILKALRKAGCHVELVQTTETVTPYLAEIDVFKRGATREQIDEICTAADPAPRPTPRPSAEGNARYFGR